MTDGDGLRDCRSNCGCISETLSVMKGNASLKLIGQCFVEADRGAIREERLQRTLLA